MLNFNNFPQPPIQNGGYYPQYNYYQQQPTYTQQVYSSNGTPVQAETYVPQEQPQQSTESETPVRKSRFGNLIGTHVMVDTAPIVPATEEDKKPVAKRKNKTSVDKPKTSKEIVENTIYADTYADTSNMAYGVIAQADELLGEAKVELNRIRGGSMKGKYMYMNNMLASMSSLMSTKLQAIREINNSIKNANDMEYRRFKDNRAIESTDDNKAVMDAYKAFISAPVGAPAYHQPTTLDITAGLNGVVPSEKNKNFINSNGTTDTGYMTYLNNLSPEENLMINDSNPNVEEVIIYDQSTGMKYFQWIDNKTGKEIPNMPHSSDVLLEDYVIDPRTRMAKNNNLHSVMRVIYKNEDSKLSQY